MTNMSDRKDMSKSAPANGRRESTTEIKKSSTIKDINNWINKDNSDPLKRSTARHVSQLTENVTEERMLYARQLELGRERYKFLVSHEYEKQKFVERQTGKEKMMKKYMASARKIIEKAYNERPNKKTLTVRIPQVEYMSQSSTPVQEDQAERLDSRTSKASTRSLKKGTDCGTGMPRLESRPGSRLVGKSDTERSKSRTRGRVSVVQTQRTPKEITFVDYSRPDSRATVKNVKDTPKVSKPCNELTGMEANGVYLNTSANEQEDDETEKRDRDGRLPLVVSHCNRRNFNNERNVSRLSARSRSSTCNKHNKQTFDTRPVCDKLSRTLASLTEPITPMWNKKKEYKFGEKFGSSITDPRYVALQNTLQPADLPLPTTAEIKDIISKNYVLRTSSRCESAANAKFTHAKFIALILQKELSVD